VTIQELGSIGEFIAAIATIATLFYLAVQIRQSTSLSRSAATQEVLNSHRELIRELLVLNADTGELFARGLGSFSQLEAGEKRRFHSAMADFLLHCQNALQLRDKGILDSQGASVWMQFTLQLLRMPGAAEWWSVTSEVFDPAFRAEVERELQKPGPSIAELLPFYGPETAVRQSATADAS